MATARRDAPLGENGQRRQASKSVLVEKRMIPLSLTPFEWGMVDEARAAEDLAEFVSGAIRQYLVDHYADGGRESTAPDLEQAGTLPRAVPGSGPQAEEEADLDRMLLVHRELVEGELRCP